jgi:hypothetical protein
MNVHSARIERGKSWDVIYISCWKSVTSLVSGFGIEQFQSHFSEKRFHSWPCRSRHYERFARIAGVRGDGPEPRGLPDDISETAAYLAYKCAGDGHSHSWLSLKEACDIWEDTSTTKHDNPADYWFGAYPEDGDKKWDDYRIVFWFDN